MTEINVTEMSTIRMRRDEPYITIWFNGPKGGHIGMNRIDIAEAAKLAEALAKAVQELRQ
jgi:hypothetical protein